MALASHLSGGRIDDSTEGGLHFAGKRRSSHIVGRGADGDQVAEYQEDISEELLFVKEKLCASYCLYVD